MFDPNLLRERAERGAQYLDKVKPGWFRNLQLRYFRMQSCTYCVLGQLMGHYEDALIRLPGPDKLPVHERRDWAESHGFDIYDFEQRDFDELTKIWLELIADRRDRDATESQWD